MKNWGQKVFEMSSFDNDNSPEKVCNNLIVKKNVQMSADTISTYFLHFFCDFRLCSLTIDEHIF